MKKKILCALACAVSAFLLWSAFPPCGEAVNLIVALVPVLIVSRLMSVKQSALLWFLAGFLFWFATLSWMPAISRNNGPLPLVVLGWVGLAGLCAGYFSLFGALDALFWRRVSCMGAYRAWMRLLGVVFIEPLLWAGVEWMRATLFTGFAWNFLGTAVASVPSFATPARLGGVYLVSALVVLVNGVFATLGERVIRQMLRESPSCGRIAKILRSCETALPLLVVLSVLQISKIPAGPNETLTLRAALVQRNAPCIFSADVKKVDPLEEYKTLLATASLAKPDIVVLAESEMGRYGDLDRYNARAVAKYIKSLTDCKALLSGGNYSEKTNGMIKEYNAAALYTFTKNGVNTDVYCKQHLVPFGEYIPFDKTFAILQKLSPIGVSLWPGVAKALPLETAGKVIRIAPLICFEDTDPTLSRKAANLGANVIVLVTNDSWFSYSNEALQHAQQALLRAVETGLPIIRVGNSGVTGVISPRGVPNWLADKNNKPLTDEAGCLLETIEIPLYPEKTFYTRFGDIPLLVLFALSLSVVFSMSAGLRMRGVISQLTLV